MEATAPRRCSLVRPMFHYVIIPVGASLPGAVPHLGRSTHMRSLLIIICVSALFVGCDGTRGPSTSDGLPGVATNTAVTAEESSPVGAGIIIARIVGPHRPTPATVIPSDADKITNFWVSLEVLDVRDGFAVELRGQTISLPTCEFDGALLGQTLPLRLYYRPGGFDGLDYWLTCTSLEISRLLAGLLTTK
jgi:hypothetical protein